MVTMSRPRQFTHPDALAARIEEYFEHCQETNTLPLVEELALYCDLTRQRLWEYEKRPEFFDIVKRGKERCAVALLRAGLGSTTQPAVTIFALKNGHGWTDRREVREVSINLKDLSDEQLERIAAGEDPVEVMGGE